MYVIGTAGHVDHGKSALVQALTGIDPDRLREEKERGMTIDLGFAWLKLPGGNEVSIVDVPGHERFIKNMLAGAGGIDVALLVVAADEGVMPQTREHLAILDLLGVASGVVALTKSDLVDGDWLEMVAADVEELLGGTALEGAPAVACSAVTRQGLDGLLAALESRLADTPPKRDIGRPRLPIDRAFTVAGFGTVVTGTLTDGALRLGQEVEVVPAPKGRGELRSRVRGLQTHRRQVEEANPGTRAAVNLPGLSTDDLHRGQVVTTSGWLVPTLAVDVWLRALASAAHTVRHNSTLSFHTAAAEVSARLRLLDRDELSPGDEGWAQLRLLSPVAVVKGDRFVVRTANDTVGGGQIVDPKPRRHRRFHGGTLEALARAREGSPEETVLALLRSLEPCEVGDLAKRSDLSSEEARAAVERLVAAGQAVALTSQPNSPVAESLLYSASGFETLTRKAAATFEAFYREHPLRSGMPREELRTRLGLTARVFAAALGRWAQRGDLLEEGATVALPGRQVKLTSGQEREAAAYLAALGASPFSPPTDRQPPPDLLAYLEEEGKVVTVAEGVVFGAAAYQEMVERIVGHLREEGTITLAQVRDMFGTSRKYAQALLEHLDARRITRRVGDERVLRSPPAG